MRWEVRHGDCIALMRAMPDASVDAVVTDPPYELGFMGRSWDASGIAFNVEVWAEALRVLKPGGHLLAFSGSRTYHRMACAIEDAGFHVRDQIMWLYGSGFPKSLDVSKAVDAIDRTQASRQRALTFTAWMRSTGITAREIDRVTGTNMGGHYLTDAQQPAVATADLFDLLRPLLPTVPEEIEELVRSRTVESENMKRREVLSERTMVQCGGSSLAIRMGDRREVPANITAPATDAARRWSGWGTALKPAHEPICLARKPLDGTVAANVLKHGTGAINVDGCRVVGPPSGLNPYTRLVDQRKSQVKNHFKVTFTDHIGGRWPANVLHDGSDEATEGLRDAARYFYCAKASRADREHGCEELPARSGAEAVERDEDSADMASPRAGAGRTAASVRNHHPTVKPTELMRYLCRLVVPPGGLVLDPFTGSGSTGRGAVLEGFRFIGCEQSEEYVAIARARIAAAATGQLKLV